jgi:DNA-binding NtrC family response regulator
MSGDSSGRVIWIIDAEQWPRALLRAELIERGYDAVGYVTVRDAIDSLPWRRPDAIVVDLRGQPIPLVERLLKLNVPIVIVGGVPEINDLPDLPWTAVLRRPLSIGQIADRVAACFSTPTTR